MRTRRLDDRQFVRGFVHRAEVAHADGRTIVLRAEHRRSDRHTRTAAGTLLHPPPADLGGVMHLDASAGSCAATVRLDLVDAGILRVRFALGGDVPENHTPMLVGALERDAVAAVERDDGAVHWRTPLAVMTVTLEPFAIRIARDGRAICRIGGVEKNFFGMWDSLNTGVCTTVPEGDPLAVEVFALRPGEAVYGFGEKFCGLDKVGQTVDLHMMEAMGTSTPRSYKNVPFFLTTQGYGVFVNQSARMTFAVGARHAADIQLGVEDDFLDYFVLLGDVRDILGRYTSLTGAPRVPPAWSFGFWQSKISYSSAAQTLDVVRRYRAAGLPLDVLHLDTFWFRQDWRCDLELAPDRFPDPAGYFRAMRELGVRVSLWQLPYVPEGSAYFDELAAVDGFVRGPDGRVVSHAFAHLADFDGTFGIIDLTNPTARGIYQRRLGELVALGAAAIKADFGEDAPLDGTWADGTPGHRMRNLYPLLYNQAVAEATHAVTGEWIIWARSAYAGSQRYPLHWGGDNSTNWDNLAPQLAGGLSLGLSGLPFWSQDIGGFYGLTGGALLVRWLQAGLFLSHARIHGVGIRELDALGEDVLRNARRYLRLRYRLLPYLLGSALTSAERSLPMARALVVDFQDDPTTWRIADQWLLGDALLVAPILDETDERRVYLPAGASWSDWWTGAVHEGGRWLRVHADLDTLPLFVREGGVVPLGPELDFVGQRPTTALTVRVAPFRRDGITAFAAVADEAPIPLRYRAAGGRHTLECERDDVAVELELLAPARP